MPKPPPDTDPEIFIIGHGVYGNLQIATPLDDANTFRLIPTPTPVGSIICHNLIFVAFFFGFYWLCEHLAHGNAERWAIYAPLVIGTLTCTVFTTITYISFDRAIRQGPWLAYEKATGRLTLPRDGITFEPSEIVHLQYITTKRLDGGGAMNNERLSELNLITCRDGVRKRWPLLRSIANVRAFDRLLKPLVKNTNLPVMRVEDEWRGWNVTQRRYDHATH